MNIQKIPKNLLKNFSKSILRNNLWYLLKNFPKNILRNNLWNIR
jgi:hypothetical protein